MSIILQFERTDMWKKKFHSPYKVVIINTTPEIAFYMQTTCMNFL